MPKFKVEYVETVTTVRMREIEAPTVDDALYIAEANGDAEDWPITYTNADTEYICNEWSN